MFRGLPEEVEGAGGREAALQQHTRQGFVGGVLADEVHAHGDGGADGTDAQGEELGAEEVLAGVPTCACVSVRALVSE